MFGFKKTSELDRLRAVYKDQSDGELLHLHEGRDGLTDAGRQALDEAMQLRGLEPAADADSSLLGTNEGTTSSDAGSNDELELCRFKDTYQLREMIRLLEESGTVFRVQDFDEFYGDEEGRGQRETGLRVLINRTSEREARKLLHQVLFPTGHDKEGSASMDFRPPRDLVLLSLCFRDDGHLLAQALSEAGVSFYWRDGREDNEVPGEDRIAIEVQSAQQDEAETVLHAWMAAQDATGDHDLYMEA